jgi:ABC-type lipoprotein release transport system permease subunit
MFIIAIGATTTRYAAVIEEMSYFFRGDVVVVARGVFVIQAFPIGGTIQEDVVEKLKQMNGVKTAVPILFTFNPHRLEGAIQLLPHNVSIGIPLGNWSILVGSTPLKEGNWPSSDYAEEIVIGPSIADNCNLTIGSIIKIKGYDLEVVGIMETRSPLLSRTVIMPLKLAQNLYGYTMLINMVIVEPEEKVDVKELTRKIEMEIASVKALTEDERSELIEPILQEVKLWNIGLQGVLFSMSMMLIITVAMMNVFERKRDFATMQAIGATNTSIIRIVLTEIALVGFFGSFLGIWLGAGVALLMVSFYTDIPVSLIFPDIFVIVPPFLIIKILASAVVVSCIAGIIPALTAIRTNIAEVLRAEY